MQAYYWAKTGKRNVQHEAIGASGSLMGICAAIACTMPNAMVSVYGIRMPIWLQTVGMVLFSLAAHEKGLFKRLGHLRHLGGMAFGAVWWVVVLRPVMYVRKPG